jgi:hypothetical protein
MLRFAPRISPRLIEAIVRFDDHRLPIAETNRRVGAEAERLRLPRPSYERVRVLVQLVRAARRRASRRPSTASLLLDVALRIRPPDVLLDRMAGIPVQPYPRRPP